jgi:hypothetical protein
MLPQQFHARAQNFKLKYKLVDFKTFTYELRLLSIFNIIFYLRNPVFSAILLEKSMENNVSLT